MSAARKQMVATAEARRGAPRTRAAGKQIVGTAVVQRRVPWTRTAGKLILAQALALVLATAGWSRGLSAQAQPAPQEKMTPAQIEALFKARSDSARMHFTAADVHFMTGMIEHHGQALAMAAMAPTHGAGPSLQTLCERIINAQKDEIATMQQWLRERGQPVPEVEIQGTMVMLRFPDGAKSADAARSADKAKASESARSGDMQMAGMDMGGGAMPMMPGMLTPEQMAALDRARGTEFDRLFLQGMIQHHSGAITMVRDLWNTPGEGLDEQAFKLANDIQVDQTTEIARMRLMLAALPPVGT